MEEGIGALTDIDIAMQLGAGWSEGPLTWADGRGLAVVASDLDRLAQSTGERFAPRTPLTDRLTGDMTFTTTTTEDHSI